MEDCPKCGMSMNRRHFECECSDPVREWIKQDQDNVKRIADGVSSSDLMDYLRKVKVVCGGAVMRCVEIRCVSEDGSVWNPKWGK